MRRLGSEPAFPPMFFLEKIQKAKQDLETEQRLLEVAKCEVSAREERITFLQDVLDKACKGDMEVLISFNSRIPALPSRPARKHVTRQPRAAWTGADRCGRKRAVTESCSTCG